MKQHHKEPIRTLVSSKSVSFTASKNVNETIGMLSPSTTVGHTSNINKQLAFYWSILIKQLQRLTKSYVAGHCK